MLLVMNNVVVFVVNGLSVEELFDLIGFVFVCLVVIFEDVLVGFLLCIVDGVDYGSVNYKWLSVNCFIFVYIDRICVDEMCCGLKIGDYFY